MAMVVVLNLGGGRAVRDSEVSEFTLEPRAPIQGGTAQRWDSSLHLTSRLTLRYVTAYRKGGVDGKRGWDHRGITGRLGTKTHNIHKKQVSHLWCVGEGLRSSYFQISLSFFLFLFFFFHPLPARTVRHQASDGALALAHCTYTTDMQCVGI
ncbi:hypothetical protein LX36DRAFT_405134 [Colletotrichum falcatum]|nr:hypothetical protein LX36DRAFT_405134 [Colletotrichum falcatum]